MIDFKLLRGNTEKTYSYPHYLFNHGFIAYNLDINDLPNRNTRIRMVNTLNQELIRTFEFERIHSLGYYVTSCLYIYDHREDLFDDLERRDLTLTDALFDLMVTKIQTDIALNRGRNHLNYGRRY